MVQVEEAPSMLQRKLSRISFRGAVSEAEYPVSRSIDTFNEKKWKKNCDGSRKKELSAVDYGLLWT